MRITAFYASLLTLLYLFLSVRVIGWRRTAARRDRACRGCAALTPYARARELRRVRALRAAADGARGELGPATDILHLVGLTLVAGRMLHAYGLSQTPQILNYSVWGMQLTFTAMASPHGVLLAVGAVPAV